MKPSKLIINFFILYQFGDEISSLCSSNVRYAVLNVLAAIPAAAATSLSFILSAPCILECLI